ncbi:hypothetical protein ACDX78_06765 [Virgibacillus oceani]
MNKVMTGNIPITAIDDMLPPIFFNTNIPAVHSSITLVIDCACKPFFAVLAV